MRFPKYLIKEYLYFFFTFLVSFFILVFSIVCLDETKKLYTFFITLSGGVFSACILYVIVEIFPTAKKRKNTLKVLNMAICSVLEAYYKPKMFQHEKSIRYVSLEYIDSIDKIKKAQKDIKNFNINYRQLQYSIQTAHSRYNDFQNLLILSNDISPNHSLLWLDLIEKIRLMSEEYNNFIENPDTGIINDLSQLKKFEDIKNETFLMCDGFQIRVLEFFESVEKWINENN